MLSFLNSSYLRMKISLALFRYLARLLYKRLDLLEPCPCAEAKFELCTLSPFLLAWPVVKQPHAT